MSLALFADSRWTPASLATCCAMARRLFCRRAMVRSSLGVNHHMVLYLVVVLLMGRVTVFVGVLSRDTHKPQASGGVVEVRVFCVLVSCRT